MPGGGWWGQFQCNVSVLDKIHDKAVSNLNACRKNYYLLEFNINLTGKSLTESHLMHFHFKT